MRKTKIICTIGPASENEKTFTQMCKAGLNVARLNFSHGSYEEHQKKIDMIFNVKFPIRTRILLIYANRLRLLRAIRVLRTENAYNNLNPIFRMLSRNKRTLYTIVLLKIALRH